MERNFVEFFRTAESGLNSSLVLYYAGRETCLPGHDFGPAVRGHYLLHFILAGHGEFHVNGHIYPLGPNQAFIIQPGESFLVRTLPEGSAFYELRSVEFS